MSVLPFLHPATIVIAGPTKAGKTQFVIRLLKHVKVMFDPPPQRIVFVYGEKQDANKTIQELLPDIEMTNKFDKDLYNSFDKSTRNLLILDDQMDELGGDPILVKLFTKGSHHRNLSIILILQNLYHQGKSMVTVGRNAHYKVLLKNPTDRRQIITLASSMMPGNTRRLVDSFADAAEQPYQYLVVDCTQETPDCMRLRTRIFPDDQRTLVYTGPDYISDSDEEDDTPF